MRFGWSGMALPFVTCIDTGTISARVSCASHSVLRHRPSFTRTSWPTFFVSAHTHALHRWLHNTQKQCRDMARVELPLLLHWHALCFFHCCVLFSARPAFSD